MWGCGCAAKSGGNICFGDDNVEYESTARAQARGVSSADAATSRRSTAVERDWGRGWCGGLDVVLLLTRVCVYVHDAWGVTSAVPGHCGQHQLR